jgi:hypothetical protein
MCGIADPGGRPKMGEYYAPMGTPAFGENDLVLGFLVRPGTQRPLLYEFKRVVGLGGGKTFVQMASDADMGVYDQKRWMQQ